MHFELDTVTIRVIQYIGLQGFILSGPLPSAQKKHCLFEVVTSPSIYNRMSFIGWNTEVSVTLSCIEGCIERTQSQMRCFTFQRSYVGDSCCNEIFRSFLTRLNVTVLLIFFFYNSECYWIVTLTRRSSKEIRWNEMRWECYSSNFTCFL